MMKTIATSVIASVASVMLTSGVIATASNDVPVKTSAETEVIEMTAPDAIDFAYDSITVEEPAQEDSGATVTVELDGKIYKNCVMTVDELDDTRYICGDVKILVHSNDVVLYDSTNSDEPAIYAISDLIVR